MIVYDRHQCTNHFLCIAEIITIIVVLYITYECAIMLEIALNITLHGSNCN